MGLIGNLVGTPKEHKKEKEESEVVELPEFDITQYAKKLGLAITSLAVVGAAALKGFDVKQTEGMVIAVFGVIAAALLGTSLVMAVDLASRAYLTASGAAKKRGGGDNPDDDPPPDSELVAAPPGTMVWLKDDSEPHPVLAMAGDGKEASSYLVATGAPVKRPPGNEGMQVIDGSPEWRSADDIRGVKTAKWP